MAKVDLSHLRFVGLPKHYDMLMDGLQKRGDIHIETHDVPGAVAPTASVDLAKLEYYLRTVGGQVEQSTMDGILKGERVVVSEEESKQRATAFASQLAERTDTLERAEEQLVRSQNTIPQLQAKIDTLTPYKNLELPLGQSQYGASVVSWVGRVGAGGFDALVSALAEASTLTDVKVLESTPEQVYIRVLAHADQRSAVAGVLDQKKFKALDTRDMHAFAGQSVTDALAALQTEKTEHEAHVVAAEAAIANEVQYIDDARVLFDHMTWEDERATAGQHVLQRDALFAFEAWVPSSQVEDVKTWAAKSFVNEVDAEVLDTEAKAPTLLKNEGVFTRPFESLTKMFGMPGGADIDPTPFMAPFYVIFFGICLSDVGYGMLITLTTLFLWFFGTYDDDTKDTIKFMLYCGLSAIVGGVLLGGYFGMTPEQAPGFLVADSGSDFVGQILNLNKGTGLTDFLLFSIYVGVFQLLFGVVVEGYKYFATKNYSAMVLDSGAWFAFLVSLFGYFFASFEFGIADTLGINEELFKYMTMVTGVILVGTQGRSESNWLMKPIVGVLSLYGVMNYLSDILSYSRLMALGLATGVVGAAMNTTAAVLFDMVGVPGLAHMVAGVVLIFGHGLNFALSMLGASIHSMRLQFIEFFGRFYTGGGTAFEPLARKARYLLFRSS